MRHTDLKTPLTEGQRRVFVHFSLAGDIEGLPEDLSIR